MRGSFKQKGSISLLPVECKEDMKIIQYKAAIGDKLVLFETKNYNVLCGGA